VGKGVIVSEQGAGLYTIKKEVRGLAAARALAADRRERLEAESPELRLEEEAALNAVVYQRFVTDTLLNDWLAGIEIPEDTLNFELRYGITDEARAYVQAQTTGLEVPAALMNAIHELVEKRMILDDIRRQIDRKSAEYLAVLKWQGELTALQNIADTPIPAWCVQHVEGLSGRILTLEVPGEVDPALGGGINFVPGFNEETDQQGGYDRFGMIQFGKTLSPAGFAWNMTMLTPWIKWNPLWRYGTVTAVDVDANTINVELEPILSKTFVWLRRDLTINDPWQSQMTGVWVAIPCGAKLFAIGDEAVVAYSTNEDREDMPPSWSCIGFKHSPKYCEVDEDDPYDGINPGGADGDFPDFIRMSGRNLPGPYSEGADSYGLSVSGDINSSEGRTISGSGVAFCQDSTAVKRSLAFRCSPLLSQILIFIEGGVPGTTVKWWPTTSGFTSYRSSDPFVLIPGVGDPSDYHLRDDTLSINWESYRISDFEMSETEFITQVTDNRSNGTRTYIYEPDPPCGGTIETSSAWSGTFYQRNITADEYQEIVKLDNLPNVTIWEKGSDNYRFYKPKNWYPEDQAPFHIRYERVNYSRA
jgi:hypothetical protein